MESLDVLIGLVTIYLTVALACTAMVEAVAAFTQVRSKNLQKALNQYFSGSLSKERSDFVVAFYAHPLVKTLTHDGSGRPSYIPPHVVGLVVESLVRDGNTADSLTTLIAKLPGDEHNNPIKGVLDALKTQAGEDSAAFRAAVSAHFDSVMDRASGWVKRRQQNVALICAAVLVVGGNVDTFDMATRLYASPELRAQLYTIAQQRQVEMPVSASGADAFAEALRKTEQAGRELEKLDAAVLSFSFGWSEVPTTLAGAMAKFVGLVISIFAVSLGAPFWFDVLQRFMNIREAGRSPREERKKKQPSMTGAEPQPLPPEGTPGPAAG